MDIGRNRSKVTIIVLSSSSEVMDRPLPLMQLIFMDTLSVGVRFIELAFASTETQLLARNRSSESRPLRIPALTVDANKVHGTQTAFFFPVSALL